MAFEQRKLGLEDRQLFGYFCDDLSSRRQTIVICVRLRSVGHVGLSKSLEAVTNVPVRQLGPLVVIQVPSPWAPQHRLVVFMPAQDFSLGEVVVAADFTLGPQIRL